VGPFCPDLAPWQPGFREAEALEAVEESASYVPKTSWR
jgi:hypothetical protein